jgi:PHS family inorganic phosphate transporter-like MFS transporter
VLIQQTKQYILTVSLASIAGSACFIIFANRIPRKKWLTVSFFVLAVLFIITGGIYYGVHQDAAAPATVVFVAICHFMFNMGKKCPIEYGILSHPLLTSLSLSSRRKHTDIHHTG